MLRSRYHPFLIALLLFILPMAAFCIQATPDSRIKKAIDSLQAWYTPRTGLYRTTGWWNSANAITTLANYSRVAQTEAYLPTFTNTLQAAQTGPDGAIGFLNKYYDDEGWWALAWIDVYDLTKDDRYFKQAEAIFKDMQLGWDDETCGGGVWWSKDKKDKNAIENELFLSVAAAIANREKDPILREDAMTWMYKEWHWFRDSGMIDSEHLINDGLTPAKSTHCANNGMTTWTYNQGVILGGLVEMEKAERSAGKSDDGSIKLAELIAVAAMTHLKDPHGALGEPNGAHDGGDVPQFKGIFVRNLMQLNSRSPVRGYRKFIEFNAKSILEKDSNNIGQLGFWWGGPFDTADASRQSSALDLLVAAEALKRSKQ